MGKGAGLGLQEDKSKRCLTHPEFGHPFSSISCVCIFDYLVIIYGFDPVGFITIIHFRFGRIFVLLFPSILRGGLPTCYFCSLLFGAESAASSFVKDVLFQNIRKN